jgi:protein-ribulosamine 3-kinase
LIPAALREALAAATGSAACDEAEPVAGGCINRCYAARRGSERWFVKLNDGSFADAFAGEADGLAALAAAGARTPIPIAHGRGEHGSYLVLEWLPLGRGDAQGFRALGEMLARIHESHRDAYGWTRDNRIGATPQANGRIASWREFWVERRLRPQLALAARNGHHLDADRAVAAATALLAAHVPPPALLHGDLWGGNAAFLADGTPVLFDPAVYAGDAEADLAMTELFGGFPAAFREGYGACRPVDAGYAVRRDLYNLYHVLNHLNLFGGGYLAQAQRLIASLAAAAR